MLVRPPRLSLGLPVYNGGHYLNQALDSLLGQTFEDFELIISDNASTDETGDTCRDYARRDGRIRYVRQVENIGAAPNQDFVFRMSRSELFKWAGADDLFARDLLERCIAVLDESPDVVIAHSWTAAIDEESRVVQALPYPLATDSRHVAERLRSQLLGEDLPGSIRADDEYGVIRSEVLRQVKPHGSYYNADRAFITQLLLRGRFVQIPEWLYFRRHHAERALKAHPTVRSWCTNLDPRRASRLRHPTVRLYGEYVIGYLDAIRRAPITAAERRECYAVVGSWAATRVAQRVGFLAGEPTTQMISPGAAGDIDLDRVVAGRSPV